MLNTILNAILYGIAILFYYIEVGLAKVLDKLYQMFKVFAGITPVTYKGESMTILDVFFTDDLITAVYWGMAMIGICLLFAFALVAVIKKMFDSTGERVKQTYGGILVSTFKSALIMFLMTAIMLVATSSCSVVLTAVDNTFNKSSELAYPSTITFSDEDNANMFRVIDTIANYSMNPSPESRFNVNICFNEICADMKTLEATGMFRYTYEGSEDSWQYALKQIYVAADIHSGVPVDEYNDSVALAITSVQNQVKYNSDFKPLQRYSNYYSSGSDTNLGTLLMLAASFDAANNDSYNGSNAYLTDNVRGPFYSGSRNLYNRKTCEKSFNIRFDYWDHFTCLVSLCIAIYSFVKIVFNCTARIFNMVYLYIVAPPFIALTPLDDGGKFKQWITAFVIQSCSIFGIYIAIRLMLMFIPIIMSGSLVLFPGSAMDILAKVILLVGVMFTAQKSGGIFNGILADNAGMQSIMAGDVSGELMGRAAKTFSSLGSGIATATGLGTLIDKAKKGMRENGGIVGAARKKGEDDMKKEKDKQEADAQKKKAAADEQKQNAFQSRMLAAAEGRNNPQRNASPSGGAGIKNQLGKSDFNAPEAAPGGADGFTQPDVDLGAGSGDAGGPQSLPEKDFGGGGGDTGLTKQIPSRSDE